MNTRGEIGKRGEEAVCDYLLSIGHTILEKNWRYGHFEIDIISIDKVGIHFVEVKSRVVPVQAAPQESVNRAKKRRVVKAAQAYIDLEFKGKETEIWLDVAAVTFEGGKINLEYFEGAFVPIY